MRVSSEAFDILLQLRAVHDVMQFVQRSPADLEEPREFGVQSHSRSFARDFKAKRQSRRHAANSAVEIDRRVALGVRLMPSSRGSSAICRRSLNEVHDVLHGAQLKEYVTASELAPVRSLSNRIYPSVQRDCWRTAKSHRRLDEQRNEGHSHRQASVIAPTSVDDRTDKRRDRTDKRQRSHRQASEDRTDNRQ